MNKTDNETTIKDLIKEWKKRITSNKNKIKRRNIQIKELKHCLKIGYGEEEENKKEINKLEGEIMGFTELKEIFEDKVSHEKMIKNFNKK